MKKQSHINTKALVAKLVYSEGSSAERIHSLHPDGNEILIGRDRACMIRTTRRNVSRRHCAIRWSDGNYNVHDLESANGTFVNGREVSHHTLTDGDEIRCGLDFRIWFWEMPDSSLELGLTHLNGWQP